MHAHLQPLLPFVIPFEKLAAQHTHVCAGAWWLGLGRFSMSLSPVYRQFTSYLP